MSAPALRFACLTLVCLLADSCATGTRSGNHATTELNLSDKERGAHAAQRDLSEGRFRIIRYDLSIVRVGDGRSYRANFERFGIEELAILESKEYCDAYNKVMDDALLKKFNGPYRKLRSAILPAPDAVPFLKLH